MSINTPFQVYYDSKRGVVCTILNRRLLIYQIAIQEKLRSIPSNLLRATLKLVELSANAFKFFGSPATEEDISVYVNKTDVGVPVWFFLNLIVCDSPVILPVPYSTSLKNGLLFYTFIESY